MNKKVILVFVICLILTIILLGTKFIFDKNQSNEFNKKIFIAIDKVKEKYPDLNIDSYDAYVNVNSLEDKWYTYLFDEKDKGLGIEVYYEKGNYIISFDYEMYEYRVKLIDKMNELMLEMKELNQHVYWVPNDMKYKTIYKKKDQNIISYVVIKNNVDIDKQLAIDYEIMKHSYNLSKELNQELDGFNIVYYEGNKNDIDLTNNNSLFTKIDRFYGTSGFEVYMIQNFTDCKKGKYCFISNTNSKKIKKIGEYQMLFSTINTKAQTIPLEKVLNSKENFTNYAKSIMQ